MTGAGRSMGTLSGAGEACCLVTSLAEPRRGPLDFDIASRPAPPLSCWSVPGWVQQMNAAPTSSRIILGLAVENSSTVDWRIVAKSWGAAFDLLAASGLRLTGEDRSICVEQGARTGSSQLGALRLAKVEAEVMVVATAAGMTVEVTVVEGLAVSY